MIRLNRLVIVSAVAAGTIWGQTEPTAGTWKTWVVSPASQFRLQDPSKYGDGDASEIAWLKGYMATADANTLGQVAYWDAGPPSYRWIQIATQEFTKRNIAAPLATRAMALVSAAMYDATIAAWDSKYAYNRRRPSQVDPAVVPLVAVPQSPSFPSEHAVTAGAAAAVLSYLFPDSADLFNSLAEESARSRLFAGAQYPSDTIAGLELGRKVGASVVAAAKTDGSDAAFTGSYPLSATVWGNPNPVSPLAGNWRPWASASGSQLRPGPPPAAGSAEAAAQFAEVKNQVRTNATNHSAWFWQPTFITPWLETVSREILEHHWDTNPPRAARAYALATIAQHDATIGCWDTKYAYLELRPSLADNTIVTLFPNPAHPGYPSGHACASGASALTLGYLFPGDSAVFDAQALDAGMSTFYAGIHTTNDVYVGLSVGQAAAERVIERAQTDGAQ